MNSFDGQRFEEMAQYNIKHTSFNDYFNIYLSHSGRIFTSKLDGIHFFNYKKKTWFQNEVLKRAVTMLVLPDDREILIDSKFGLVEIDQANKITSKSPCNQQSTQDNPHILRYIENEDLILSADTKGNIVIYSSINLDCHLSKSIDIAQRIIHDIEIVNEEIWIIFSSGELAIVPLDLSEINFLTGLFDDYDKSSFSDIHKVGDIVYLCAAQQGLFEYDIKLNEWRHRKIKLLDNPQGEHEYIHTIMDDGERLYFGSFTGGLLIYDPNQINFQRIPESSLFNSTIFNLKLPRKIIEDENKNIWIGTSGLGLWKYNPSIKKIEHFSKESHPDFLRKNSLSQIFLQGNKLWIGYNNDLLDLVDIKTKKIIKSYDFDLPEIKHRLSINFIYEDKENDLWICTESHGIFIISKEKTTHFVQNNSDLSDNKVNSINRINDKLYISLFSGHFYEIDEINNSFSAIKTPFEKKNYTVKCINQDIQGNIWLGTGGQGVILLNNTWQPIDTFSIGTGDLLSDETCIILHDEQKNTWVGTNKGLVSFSKNNGQYKKKRLYLQPDGLLSNEFMTGAFLVDQNKNVWMGNIEGLNYWNPDQLVDSKEKLAIYLKKVEINNVILENLFEGDNIGSLEHKNRSINFTFSTIGFIEMSKINYRLKLVGHDEDWKELGERNHVSYTNLSSGDYTLHIQSTNYDGVWNEKTYSWKFNINSIIYEEWWFIICSFAIFLGLVIYGMRHYASYRLLKSEAKSTQERERILMEMKSLRAQINPHFLFNTLSSINNFILKNKKDIASQYLVKFSRLIRKILNYNSRKFISLKEEIEALELYIEIEQMRMGDSFDFFINTRLKENLESISVTPLILQPIVENAIWHGLIHIKGEQLLTVDISDGLNDFIHVSIKDNGIGREASFESRTKHNQRSFGMEITKKRIELWMRDNQLSPIEHIQIIDLKNEFGKATGTEVILKIPTILHKSIESKKQRI